MLSGVVLTRKFPGKSLGKVLLFKYLISGILLYLSILKGIPVALLVVVWAVLGFSYSIHTPLFSAYLQTFTDIGMLIRAASNLYTFRVVTTNAGTLLIPFIITDLGLQILYLSFGAFMAVSALAFFLCPLSSENYLCSKDGIKFYLLA